ncbi:hypothetical protein AXF42_Ash013103 [Apostasia shenzhenica]|uniref:Uncharacterized protein n=1 Tax=Apostasia shenzhenica TaxID=1088818 RepID=A0A2I0BD09_9ASPA|nr:hypothetical protein AXF42_Ash013103 [Apostasia shenzhenica]
MDSMLGGGKYECLLFDMDDTLYPLSSGINLACRKNIQDYMRERLNIEERMVPTMCLDLYREHGTTMAGLKALGYSFDDDEFHAYVHGTLPYEALKPDPIFTNADKVHVERVLGRLGLEGCFQGVICFETLNPPGGNSDEDEKESGKKAGGFAQILCKPSLEAIEAAIKIADINPNRTVRKKADIDVNFIFYILPGNLELMLVYSQIFFDDSVRNIAAGKAAGLTTVIIGSSVLVPGADVALESIHNIKEALPEIWESEDQKEMKLTNTAVELDTVALA